MNVMTFNHKDFGNVRCTAFGAEVYYHGGDIVNALGYSDIRILNDCVDKDDMLHPYFEGSMKNAFINLFGIQSLISAMSVNSGRISTHINVNKFKSWILHKVDCECIQDSLIDDRKDEALRYIKGMLPGLLNECYEKLCEQNNPDIIHTSSEIKDGKKDYYMRADVAGMFNISTAVLKKYLVGRNWMNESGTLKSSAIRSGYIIKYGKGNNQFALTQKALDELKLDYGSGIITNKQKSPMKDVGDITGNKYGRLTVVEKTNEKFGNGGWKWKCKCECGNVTYVRKGNLVNNMTKSCGCLAREKNKKNA